MINSEFELKLVTKPWGFEFELYDNKDISIWCVSIGQEHKSGYLFDSFSTSCHMHTNKIAKVVMLDGAAQLFINDKPVIVRSSEPYTIFPRTPHRLQAYHGHALLLEVELPSNRSDIVRFSDSYGRSKNTYCWDLLESDKIDSWKSELHNKETPYDITILGKPSSPCMRLSNGLNVKYISTSVEELVCNDQMQAFIVTKGFMTNSIGNSVPVIGDIIDRTFKEMLVKNNKLQSLYRDQLSGILITSQY